jgi:hypothetical protein
MGFNTKSLPLIQSLKLAKFKTRKIKELDGDTCW